jgi:6-pyruvoyltetrahydropterin/6-carboxytetrahydropterin synthase
MPLTIMRRVRFCAGHRLRLHGGRCENFHGHNYVADFYVSGSQQDEVGRVVDFSELKKRCKGWLDDNWDHAFLLWDEDQNGIDAIRMVEPHRLFVMPYNPTAENMAKYLLEEVCPTILAGTGGYATKVVIWETEDSFAEVSVENPSENEHSESFSHSSDIRD